MFGVEKHLKVLIVQHYYKYYFYYNNLFYPRDTKDQIKFTKKISKKKKNFKKEILFFGKDMLLYV